MQPLRIIVTEWSRATSPESGKLVLRVSEVVQSFFPGMFQRAGYQTILRLDPSKLAFGPLGFIASPLHQQFALVALTLPGLFRFLESSQRRLYAGRRQRRQERVYDPLLQPQAAKALVFPFGGPHSLSLEACVARNVPAGTRVGDLHFASAPPTAQQTLQQSRALPNGSTGAPTWRTPIGAQALLVRLEDVEFDVRPTVGPD